MSMRSVIEIQRFKKCFQFVESLTLRSKSDVKEEVKSEEEEEQ